MAGERILIVDDNPTNTKLLQFLLEKRGYQLVIAENGEQALAEARRAPPDLILLDLQLPGMDGFEVARRLRADPVTQNVAIIAVTAYAMKGDEQRALAAGCDAYATKPIDTRALPARITELLERRRAS